MINHTSNGSQWLLAKLYNPYDITPKNFEVKQPDDKYDVPYLTYLYWAEYVTTSGGHWCRDDMPIDYPGSWSIHCLSTEATEYQCKEVVEWYGDGLVDEAGVGDTFMCYDDSDFCFDTAIASLQSLIRSLKLTGPVAVLKKQNV